MVKKIIAREWLAIEGFDPLYGPPPPSKRRVAARSIAVLRRSGPDGEAP